mgnify:CR=1 FL=1
MRSDWKAFRQAMTQLALLVAVGFFAARCSRTLVPSGKPGCPNRTLWSDSAQRCIAREGR